MNTYFKFTYCFEESMNCFPGTVSVKQFIENTIKEEGHLEETNYELVKELCSIEQDNSTKVHVMQFPMLDVTGKPFYISMLKTHRKTYIKSPIDLHDLNLKTELVLQESIR